MLYISVDFVVQLLTGKPFSSLAASYMGKNSLSRLLKKLVLDCVFFVACLDFFLLWQISSFFVFRKLLDWALEEFLTESS